MSPWQNRRIPAFRSTSAQSSQLSSLSWQYALLLPSCVRRISSPIVIIGTPTARSSIANRFLTWRLRSDSIAGSSVGPSTPQFQLRFWSLPSRLPSPFASLCFWSYETTSLSVNPSWQVTKLIVFSGSRSSRA
jgi:hypothetical protein